VYFSSRDTLETAVLRKEPQFSHGLPVGLDFYIEKQPAVLHISSPFILHSKPAVRFLPDRLYLFSVAFWRKADTMDLNAGLFPDKSSISSSKEPEGRILLVSVMFKNNFRSRNTTREGARFFLHGPQWTS